MPQKLSNLLRSNISSVDLTPVQRDFLLHQPSPYHDSSSEPSTATYSDEPPSSKARTGGLFAGLFSMFRRIRYGRVTADSTGEAHHEEAKTSLRSHRRKEDYEETPSDRWFIILFLLLLMSSLLNLFLIFNDGPPLNLTVPKDPKNPQDLPHNGFHFHEYGKNYTCYQTHTTALEPNYEYSNTYSDYD